MFVFNKFRLTLVLGIIVTIVISGCQNQEAERVGTELMKAYVNKECDKLWPLSEESKSLAKNDALVAYYKGVCELQMGNHQKAVIDLLMAKELGLNSPYGLYLNLSAAHAMINEKDKALGYLEKLADTGYKNGNVLNRPAYDSLRSESRFLMVLKRTEPSFDVWTSLFLFVALQGLFFSFSFFFISETSTDSSKLLGILLFFFAITIASFTFYWTGYFMKYPYLNNLFHFLPYLAGPVFYLYIRNNIRLVRFERKDFIHFVPVFIVACMLAPWIARNYVNVSFGDWAGEMGRIGSNPYSKILLLGTYTVCSYRLLNISKIQNENVASWLRYLVYAFIGYFFSLLSYHVLVRYSFFNPTWDYAISLSLSFFIFLLGFLGLQRPRIYRGEHIKEIMSFSKYKRTGLTDLAAQTLKARIELVMKQKELFTNGALRLDDLVHEVKSTRHNVSMVVNKHFNESFFDFVNRYRVEYVKEKMRDPKYRNHTIIELAYESGFNNKVSFNKAFKRITGRTPSEFKKEILILN